MNRKYMPIVLVLFGLQVGAANNQVSSKVEAPHQPQKVRNKKHKFVDELLPVIQEANSQIKAEREQLLELKDQYLDPAAEPVDTEIVENIAKSYKIEGFRPTNHKDWDNLLARVDTVPLPLVVAQAAIESAWGSSRLARLGNNLFGEWCKGTGCGIVPLNKEKDRNHEFRSFDSIKASVVAYMKNLNTHKAYKELREMRKKMRKENQELLPSKLASGLLKYSTRGQAYVNDVKKMMNHNKEKYNLG